MDENIVSKTGTSRYAEFFTDFAFKRLFGSEPHKEFLMDFLNELLGKEKEKRIKNITYLKNEQPGMTVADRAAVYDVSCEDASGEQFIVEIQRRPQVFYKDRTIFYSTFLISNQAVTGKEWDYELKPVYVISFLNFEIDKETVEYRHDIELIERQTGKVFYDKLKYIYIELRKFRKKESELNTRFEKWMYVISNLSLLDRMPSALREQIFERFFEAAEVARFEKAERMNYEESLKAYRDNFSAMKTQFILGEAKGREDGREEGRKEGRKEGREDGIAEAVRRMAASMTVRQISSTLGMSEQDVSDIIEKRDEQPAEQKPLQSNQQTL